MTSVAPRSFWKAFARYRPGRLGQISVYLTPTPSRIPVFEGEYYYPNDDLVQIFLKSRHERERRVVDDTIALYFEPGTSDLSGIEVRGLRTIDVGSIRARLQERLSNHLHLLEQDLTLRAPITEQLAQLGVLDMETRKVEFFLSEFALVSERFAFLWQTFQGRIGALAARIAFSAG